MRMAARYDVQKSAWLGRLEGRKPARAAAVRMLGTRNRQAAASAAAIYAAEESAAFVAEVRDLMTAGVACQPNFEIFPHVPQKKI